MDFRTGKTYTDIPLVTIGVLSHNYSAYVLAALDSLIKQTYNFIELIIIDDKSTENTPALIDNWIQENNITCTFIKNENNIGITRVSNKIVSLAKGKYISLFAIDDIMLPEKISSQVKALEDASDEYGMCYANVETMSEASEPLGLYIKKDFVPYQGNILREYVFGKLSFATPGCLIKVACYKTAGLYDERVLYEDYNFWLRLFACFKITYTAYPCLIYRMRKTSPIFEEWTKNNRERYNRDRVLSNHQALKYINDKEVIAYLKKKNSQYLKSLALQGSSYTKELVIYLIKQNYWAIPLRVLIKVITGK